MTKIRKKIGTIPINDIEQQVQQSTLAAVTQMLQDISDFIDEETAQYPEIGGAFKFQEDPEGRSETTTDSDGKIISYRKKDGTKVECVGLDTPSIQSKDAEFDNVSVNNFTANNSTIENVEVKDGSALFSHLNLTEDGMTEFQQALKASGFKSGNGDWSNWFDTHDSAIELPIPSKAIVNISGIDAMPTKKLMDLHGYFEYWDMVGNYFKVKALLNAQGASTMNDPMKSIAVDLCTDDWIGDDTYEIKFGKWVAQDSFHLKAFYKDALKSIQPICYNIGEEITKFLDARSNRFHIEKGKQSLVGGTGNVDNDFDEALCHPDQFPVEVYLNGTYYGLFVWSLKKHRKNYSMNKKDYETILVDNVHGMYSGPDNKFNWIDGEIRNPKKLICVDGEEYDADLHMGEIIGEDTVAGNTYTFCKLNAATTGTDTFEVTSVDYNASNKDMKNTAKTKKIIEKCVKYKTDVIQAATAEEKKALCEQYFDIDNLIAYIIFNDIVFNVDGVVNNAQITIYNNKVGYNIYDNDSCLAKTWSGLLWTSSLTETISNMYGQSPLGFIYTLYLPEIKQAYKKLRDANIVSKNNFNNIVDSWCNRIGHDAFKRSIEKWSDSPSYRQLTNLNSDYWKHIMPTDKTGIALYNENTEYKVGDKVVLGTISSLYDKDYFECISDCSGQRPLTSGNSVNALFDTPDRIKKWLEKRIEFLDNLWDYNQ